MVLIFGGLSAAILLLVVWLRRRWWRQVAEDEPPIVPVDRDHLEALRRLAATDYQARGRGGYGYERWRGDA